MKLVIPKGSVSRIVTVFIQDSSSTTGAGLGSLTNTSSIVGGYVREGGTGVALAVDEDVTTEGTYQAPSAAGKVRIGTPANMRTGTYELHFHNDLWATGAETTTITLGGAANMADIAIEVQLSDPVRGLGSPTALPNAAADAAGGLPISDAGGLDMDAMAADVAGLDGAAMRGTDNAFLAASAPTNFSAMLINASGHVSRVTLVDTTTVNTDMLTAVAVWASATRTLTAGTNIVLAKGTGVTGFNDLSAEDVQQQVTDAIDIPMHLLLEQLGPAVADESIWTQSGILIGAEKPTASGTGLTFDGIDRGSLTSGVYCGRAWLDFTGSYSIEMRITDTTASGTIGVFASKTGNTEQSNWQLQKASTGIWQFIVIGVTPSLFVVSTATAPGAGEHAVVAVHDAAVPEIRLYLDGVLVGTTAVTDALNPVKLLPIMLGRRPDIGNGGGTSPFPMAGTIHECRISNIVRAGTDYTTASPPLTSDANTLMLLALDTIANDTVVATVADKTGYALAATGLDLVLVAGETVPEALRRIGATTAGVLSGAGTATEVFSDFNGVVTATATVDSSGNRSLIVWSGP